MNKFRGKALATILAAALVASSLPVTFASASTTKHASGVLTKDPDQDEFWLTNGGSSKDDRSVENFQEKIYDGSAPLETANHQDVDDPEVYSISHVSGDKLVSWDIGKDDDNSSDDQDKGDVKLSLRKSDSKGTEVIAVLYKGTYTDDDDNDVDITASTKITIHAVDENSTVIGDGADKVDSKGYYTEDDGTGCDSPELNGDDDDDDNFARKTTNGVKDSKAVAVYKAERANYQSDDKTDGEGDTSDGCLTVWKMMPTISKASAEAAVTSHNESDFLKLGSDEQSYAYVLESNNTKDITLSDGVLGSTDPATLTKKDSAVAKVEVADPTKANSDVKITNNTADVIYYSVGTAATTPTKTIAASGCETVTSTDAADNDIFIYNKSQVLVDEYQYSKGSENTTAPTTKSSLTSVKSQVTSQISLDTPTAANSGVKLTTGTGTYYSVGAAALTSGNATEVTATTIPYNATAATDNKSITDGDTVYIYSTQTPTKADDIVEAQKYSAGKPAVTPSTVTEKLITLAAPTANNSAVQLASNAGTIYYSFGDSANTPASRTKYTAAIAASAITDTIYLYNGNDADSKVMGEYSYDAGKAQGSANDYVTVTVSGTGTANLTLKGKVTNAYKSVVNKDDDIKAKVKVEKKVLVNDDSTSYTIFKNDTYRDTVIEGNDTSAFKGDEKDGADTTEMDIDGGYIVKFVDKISMTGGNGSAEATFKENASVDSITGKVTKVKVDDAKKVGTINLKAGSVAIEDSDVKVDNITTKANSGIADPTISVDADNDVGTITVKKDNDGASEVDMTAGTAKAINTQGTVKLNGGEDDKPVTVGTLTARDITIDSTDGAVSVTNIVSNAPDGNENGCVIELDGDEATVKSIDFAGFGTDLKTNDFQGTIPAPQNATAEDATLETTDEDDSFNVTGDLDIDTVNVDEDSSDVTFDGKLSVKELEGGGTMYIGANKLYVSDDASSLLVKITDNSIKAGDTIFTAKSDAVDDNDLDFYGFTVKKNAGKTTDTFVVDQLKFAGLAMNKTSDKVVLNDSATYTASAYAPGTSLPEGDSIEFDLTDNSGVFELTDNGNGTATVKCVDYDDTFAEENKATLEAYVVDADGDEDDDYGMATCKLTALKTPEKNFTSDTNSDFTVAPGASYQFKITADSAPVMTAGTAGVVNIANVGMSGKDYFIKITATGANGAKTGIYVNGTKLLVVTVGTSQTFKSDTTVNVTVKKGASYQYGITTSDGKAPSFTVGSGKVFNVKANGHNGSTYFYKITAVGSVGAQAGIYVNGSKVNVAKIG